MIEESYRKCNIKAGGRLAGPRQVEVTWAGHLVGAGCAERVSSKTTTANSHPSALQSPLEWVSMFGWARRPRPAPSSHLYFTWSGMNDVAAYYYSLHWRVKWACTAMDYAAAPQLITRLHNHIILLYHSSAPNNFQIRTFFIIV